jgi:hypothetical protein
MHSGSNCVADALHEEPVSEFDALSRDIDAVANRLEI